MVIYEPIEGTNLILAYSDQNFKIRQDGTGDLYDEAIDPDFCHRTYTETDIPRGDIKPDPDPEPEPEPELEV